MLLVLRGQVRTRTRTHAHVRTPTRTHTYARAHTYIHTYAHTNTYAHVFTRAHTYARAHTYTYAHTHEHIHRAQIQKEVCHIVTSSRSKQHGMKNQNYLLLHCTGALLLSNLFLVLHTYIWTFWDSMELILIAITTVFYMTQGESYFHTHKGLCSYFCYIDNKVSAMFCR